MWKILEVTDKDFVPPLSARKPITLGKMKTARAQWSLPLEHLDFIMNMYVVLAWHDDKLVGFLSFIPDFHHESIPYDSCVYIDMVAVHPTWRRKGVARTLYKALFETEIFRRHQDTVLHTWSTNNSHSELIVSLGFEEIDRVPNERAPGVDTVVFHRTTKPNPFTEED